jgi:hypothetical protein
MRRLDLDFHRARPAAPWAGWALLAVALAFTLDLGRSFQDARVSVARQEAQLARGGGRAAAPRAAAPEELAAARDTIRRLATPWGELFAALESAPTEGVALLSVAPDPQGASVLIAGEARDYGALLGYLEALRRAPPLARAYLVRHEARAGAAAGVTFTLRAPWGRRP